MVTKGFTKRRGKYGRSKYRAFLVLERLGPKYGRQGWLSTRELCILSGLPYNSLTKLLSKWVGFQYVERRPCPVQRRGDFEYRLAVHGKAWLNCARQRLYNRRQFLIELRGWVNAYALPNYEALLGLPFKKLVSDMAVLSKEVV